MIEGEFMKQKLAALLALSLLLSGCGTASPAASTPPSAQETSAPAIAYNDSLIGEVHKTGSFRPQGQDTSLTYDYTLPQILTGSQAALEFNNSVLALIPAEGTLPKYEQITWESHWSGSFLSLLLHLHSPHGDTRDHIVFNYDFETRKAYTAEELGSLKGFDQEALQQRLLSAAASLFDKIHDDLDPELQKDLRELRARTISDTNLNIWKAPLFLMENGELSALVTMFTPADPSYEERTVPLTPPASVQKTVTDGFASAALQNGQVTVSFHPSEDAPWSFGQQQVPMDQPIAVDRIFGNYVDITIGNLSPEFWPVVILLDENGQVTEINLMEYDLHTGTLHGVGPTVCTQKVKEFSETQSFGITVPCGVGESGEIIDLYHPIYDAAFTFSNYLYATNWTSADGKYSMVFPRTAAAVR